MLKLDLIELLKQFLNVLYMFRNCFNILKTDKGAIILFVIILHELNT